MTFGEKAFHRIREVREQNNSVLPAALWIATIDALYTAELPSPNRRKPRPQGEPKEGRPRNPLFDALALATGCPDLAKLTRPKAREIGTALADIKAVSPNVTVDEIRWVCAAYVRKWTEPRNLTAKAVAKRWDEFARRMPHTGPRVSPVGWLGKLNELFPVSVYSKDGVNEFTAETDYNWSKLPPTVQQQIAEALR